MGRKFVDLTDKRFGRLTAVGLDGAALPYTKWICVCSCGGFVSVHLSMLQRDLTRSCGCLRLERFERMTTHGDSGSKEHNIWKAMIRRCENNRAKGFEFYGGRGIKVCKRWRRSYAAFLADMGRCPAGRSIDRKNNDGDYKPSNCRWATAKQQANNRRKRRKTCVSNP